MNHAELRIQLELCAPLIKATQGCPQDPSWHAEGDVWTHTQMVRDELERVEGFADLPDGPANALRLAAALHDVGKVSTSQIWFDGRVAKMTSQLAALATLWFNRRLSESLPPEYVERMPTFDARVWQVPTRTEGANVFVWREWDATKNSISMAASDLFSDKQLHGKSGPQKQDMMFLQHGVNWNDFPASFKRGVYVQRRTVSRPFNAVELEALPPKHNARKNPSLVVERSVWAPIDMPIFTKVTNREEVVFCGALPQVDG